MTNVRCTVENCSYYNGQNCYAKEVKIGGQGATGTDTTCCGSFLNQESYSNLAAHTEYKSPVSEVACNVQTCQHNAGMTCTLDCIEVRGSSNTMIYTETDCMSFDKK